MSNNTIIYILLFVFCILIFVVDDPKNADACECGSEPSGSVKCGEFLD